MMARDVVDGEYWQRVRIQLQLGQNLRGKAQQAPLAKPAEGEDVYKDRGMASIPGTASHQGRSNMWPL